MGSRQESSSLEAIMSVRDPSDGLRNRSELPNQKLEVRLHLTKRLDDSDFSSLKSDLLKDGMEVQEDAYRANGIVVSGIPPEGRYEEKVLNKVKTHDDGAYIIPPTTMVPT